MNVVWIKTKQEMYDLRTTLGVRMDWHEPDEQDVSLTFHGETFDNAFCDESEAFVELEKDDTRYRINAALLLAWAAGYNE